MINKMKHGINLNQMSVKVKILIVQELNLSILTPEKLFDFHWCTNLSLHENQ